MSKRRGGVRLEDGAPRKCMRTYGGGVTGVSKRWDSKRSGPDRKSKNRSHMQWVNLGRDGVIVVGGLTLSTPMWRVTPISGSCHSSVLAFKADCLFLRLFISSIKISLK